MTIHSDQGKELIYFLFLFWILSLLTSLCYFYHHLVNTTSLPFFFSFFLYLLFFISLSLPFNSHLTRLDFYKHIKPSGADFFFNLILINLLKFIKIDLLINLFIFVMWCPSQIPQRRCDLGLFVQAFSAFSLEWLLGDYF